LGFNPVLEKVKSWINLQLNVKHHMVSPKKPQDTSLTHFTGEEFEVRYKDSNTVAKIS